jgi:sugar/nucleoside kinase (ribokinase family)
MRLVVVGSVALDSVETALGRRDRVLGGSASFFSVAASFFAPAQVVAVVGDDFPEQHLDLLRSRGVDLSGLTRMPGQTFYWSGRYAADFSTRETLETRLGVFADFRPELLPAQRQAELLFLANIDPRLQLRVREQVGAPRLVAADTIQMWIGSKREELGEVLRCIDLIVVNDEEVREISGLRGIVTAAAAVLAMGPRAVIVKRGDAGALLFQQDGCFFIPAYPVRDVVDPTGAGDSFAGGFMGLLAREQDLSPAGFRRAMVAGSVMGSFCVEDFSLDRFRRLSAEEVRARFVEFAELVRFDPTPPLG